MSDLAIISTYSVFLASYLVFALGKFPGMKIDRPGAAIIGAVLMFMTGAVRVDNSLHLIHCVGRDVPLWLACSNPTFCIPA